jgi:hypothetical protein
MKYITLTNLARLIMAIISVYWVRDVIDGHYTTLDSAVWFVGLLLLFIANYKLWK